MIEEFNKRDKAAFTEIYIKIFDELYHYAYKLFNSTTIDPEDLLHDIFVAIWLNDKTTFVSVDHIKNYIYLCLKNRFRDYIAHSKYVTDYERQVKNSPDFHVTNIVESEVLSALNAALDILPAECAKVFRLYIEGWDTKEIAQKLDKAPSTVYNQKNLAISILKKNLSNKNFIILLTFF